MDFNTLSVYDFRQGDILEEGIFSPDYGQVNQKEQSVLSDGLLDYLQHSVESPPLQTCLEEITEHWRTNVERQEHVGKEPNPVSFAASLLEDCEQQPDRTPHTSTTDILRAALKKNIADDFRGVSEEVQHKLQLVEFLVAAVEKVASRKYNEAHALLDYCDRSSNESGNPVERIVFHFSSALRERIHQDTAPSTRVPTNRFAKRLAVDLEEIMKSMSRPILTIHQKVPFCQVLHFCAMQTIEEHVVTARRVHIIDLAIRSGVQWPALMQGLVGRHEYPVKHLKITAVGTLAKEFLDETGQRLQLFAHELNLSFSFRVVMLSDTKAIREDMFDVEEGECVIVSAHFAMTQWVPWQNRNRSLVTAIKRTNPTIMVVTDVESTLTDRNLISQFEEALLYFGGFIDSLEDCLGRNDDDRMLMEHLFLKKEIINLMTMEEMDMKVKGWRKFITSLGVVQIEISDACIYQAKLVRSNFKSGNSCMLKRKGKSLLIGWKGTPLHFFSVWKFSQDH